MVKVQADFNDEETRKLAIISAYLLCSKRDALRYLVKDFDIRKIR